MYFSIEQLNSYVYLFEKNIFESLPTLVYETLGYFSIYIINQMIDSIRTYLITVFGHHFCFSSVIFNFAVIFRYHLYPLLLKLKKHSDKKNHKPLSFQLC